MEIAKQDPINEERSEIRLLLVDDELPLLNALRRLFRSKKYRVSTANCGEEALTILEQQSIDVLITDMLMPMMSGTVLLSLVSNRWPLIPKIVLTGYADLSKNDEAIRKIEIFRFLSKPWDEQELINAVDGAYAAYQSKTIDTEGQNE